MPCLLIVFCRKAIFLVCVLKMILTFLKCIHDYSQSYLIFYPNISHFNTTLKVVCCFSQVMNLLFLKVLTGLLVWGYLCIGMHQCGLCQVFSSLFPESVSNTRSLQTPTPPFFSFQHSASFLAWHLRSRAHPSPSESLLGTTGQPRDGPPVFKCLPWSSMLACVHGPSSHMWGQISRGKRASSAINRSYVTPSGCPSLCSCCLASKAEWCFCCFNVLSGVR